MKKSTKKQRKNLRTVGIIVLIIILGIIFIFLSDNNLSDTKEIYQESANFLKGYGNVDGTYSQSNLNNFEKAIDGDWSTSTDTQSSGLLTIKYIKPRNSINAIWRAKGTVSALDYPIPSNCWNNSENFILLKVELDNFGPHTTGYCQDNFNWIQVWRQKYSLLYEEAIIWNITKQNGV